MSAIRTEGNYVTVLFALNGQKLPNCAPLQITDYALAPEAFDFSPDE